ncbi:MAG: FkbM family methyltransferase [Acidobacteriota bacterium]
MSQTQERESAATLALFSISRYDVGHVTTVGGATDVRVVTDPRQWSHAVEFRPRAPLDFEDGPLAIDVCLEVESGRIEVGALSTAGTAFLSSSIVDSGTHTITLHVPTLALCQSISIRNAQSVASIVRVVSIDARRDQTPSHAAELSAPYGSSKRGFWDKNIFADIRRLAGPESRLVFQVGAHDGGETSLLLRSFQHARVHCFEPSPKTFLALQDRFAGDPRTDVHQLALSDRTGVMPFHVNERSETSSLLPLLPTWRDREFPAASVIDVETSTLDEQLGRLREPLVDVLCLDTQGAELAILRGASDTLRQRRVRVLMAELIWVPVYEGQGTYYDVLHFLGHAGYQLYDLYNFHYSESGRLLWGDALFLPGSPAPDWAGSV